MKGGSRRFSLRWSWNVRRAEAPGLIFFLIFIWGCGPASYGKEEAKDGFLRPGQAGSEFSYIADIRLEETVRDEKGTLLWTSHSNLSASFNFEWKGFSQVEGYGEMGRFLYDFKIHHLNQASKIPSLDFDWEEGYGGRPPVEMKRRGLSVREPMEGISGDPRDTFLESGSEAWVSPWGATLRHEGRIPQARYHTRSAPIGQYFFKGLKVEQWAHSCFVPIPEEAWDLKDSGEGIRKVNPLVRGGGAESPVHEKWKLRRGQGSIDWQVKRKHVLPVALARGLNRAVKSWHHERSLDAQVDSVTGLPSRLEILEEGGWMERVTLGERANREGNHPWLQSSFRYSFRAHRP